MSRNLVALSGVNSAMAALLMQRAGHEVHGAHIRTWRNEEDLPFPGERPRETDQRDAAAVAERLGIPFRSIDLVAEYRQVVALYDGETLLGGGVLR